jgi:Uma2 family endonuclease
MSIGTIPPSTGYQPVPGAQRYTIDEYHCTIDGGQLTTDDRVELLEGRLVPKTPQNPPHSRVSTNAEELLRATRPPEWRLLISKPITLADSEPEPDITLARGDRTTIANRHPGPGNIGLVVEVSDSSLMFDRNDKCRAYARANLPVYWIINVVDRQIEVYTNPRPTDPIPAYATRTDYRAGDTVPLVLDGQVVAQIPVNDLLG